MLRENLKKLMVKHEIRNSYVGFFNENNIVEYNLTNNSDKKSIYNYCSISKLFTTILILKLISEEKITIDTKIKQIIKEFPDTAITIEDILYHRSGIKDDESMFKTSIKPVNHDYLASLKIENYGTFNYSDHAFMILQLVIEKICNQKFSKLIKDKIFIPLNQNSTIKSVESLADINKNETTIGYNPDDTPWKDEYAIYPHSAACGLWGSGNDLLLFAKEIVAGINDNSKLNIPKEIYQQLTKTGGASWLGLGCFLDETKAGIEIFSQGWGEGYQTMLMIYPETQKGIVILTNKNSGIEQLKGFCGEVFQLWQK